MIEKFIDMLSQRFGSENDLSDVTWALAHSCPIFQRELMRFFFRDFPEGELVTIFKREYSVGPSRPDFYIRAGTKEFIIESKIYNRSDHFDYVEQFPRAQFGYITNYHLPHRGDIKIRTWEAFRKHLVNAVAGPDIGSASKALINGYIRFLSNICSIVELKKMNLNNLNSLYHLNILFKSILNSLLDFETSVIERWNPFADRRSGRYFNWKINNKSVSPYLGIFFEKEVYIYMGFDQVNSGLIYDAIGPSDPVEGIWYSEMEKDEQSEMAVWYYLKPVHFDRFNADETMLEEQESILRSFVMEVLSYVSRYLRDDPDQVP